MKKITEFINDKVVCIYHSADLDGWMSAAIIKSKLPNAELIGYNYGEELPMFDPTGCVVIMADISFDPEIMFNLSKLTKHFIWIDHHQRTINKFIDYLAIKEFISNKKYSNITFIVTNEGELKSACELAWAYVNIDNKGVINSEATESIRLLGAYDSFRHKGTEEEKSVLNFQYGARSLISNPTEAKILLHVDFSTISDIKRKGEAIHSYLCSDARLKYKKGFPINFDGHEFIAINGERFNPINFGINYHNDGYDGACSFWYEKGNWIFSLYNDNGNVDCSLICSKRGGGGHKGASGFQTKDISQYIK